MSSAFRNRNQNRHPKSLVPESSQSQKYGLDGSFGTHAEPSQNADIGWNAPQDFNSHPIQPSSAALKYSAYGRPEFDTTHGITSNFGSLSMNDHGKGNLPHSSAQIYNRREGGNTDVPTQLTELQGYYTNFSHQPFSGLRSGPPSPAAQSYHDLPPNHHHHHVPHSGQHHLRSNQIAGFQSPYAFGSSQYDHIQNVMQGSIQANGLVIGNNRDHPSAALYPKYGNHYPKKSEDSRRPVEKDLSSRRSEAQSSRGPAKIQTDDQQFSQNLIQDEHPSGLDPSYKQQVQDFFFVGKVFKMLHIEALGQDAPPEAANVSVVNYGGQFHAKIQRFIVVKSRPRNYYSNCIQISSNNSRGTLKKGLKQEEHAIAYTTEKPPRKLPEETRLNKDPIKIDIVNISEKLNDMSRINFAKVYPVEHNVKVCEVGRVAKADFRKFCQYYEDEMKKGI